MFVAGKAASAPEHAKFSKLGTPEPAGALLAHWPFDENSGRSRRCHGQLPGTLSPTGAGFVAGVSGNALQLSRDANGYVALGDVLPNVDTSYSLSVWFKLPQGEIAPQSALFARHQPGFENGYFIVVNEVPDIVSAYSGNPYFLRINAPISDGQWHHLVLSYELGGQVGAST